MNESERPSVEGLMRVLDIYGIRHGGDCTDPAKPYSITVSVPGHGQTNCCGATVREAAQSAFDWLLTRGAAAERLCAVSAQPVASKELSDEQVEKPKPVGKLIRGEGGVFRYDFGDVDVRAIYALPPGEHDLFAAVPSDEGLTDEQIHALWVRHVGTHTSNIAFARAILAASRLDGANAGEKP